MNFRRILILLLVCTTPLLAAETSDSGHPLKSIQVLANGVVFHSGTVRVSVTAISPGVVRLRYVAGVEFPPDHSFAVLKEERLSAASATVRKLEKWIELETTEGEGKVRIERATGRIIFLDKSDAVVSQDYPDYPATWHGKEFRVYKAMPKLEQYFGLGDKADTMDHRGNAFSMWASDAYGWTQGSDPLYKDIPFFLALDQGRAYGIFLDNTYRTSFDFGKQSPDYYSFGSVGGELDYYFIFGPHPKQVIERYTALTGRTPLPPLYSLGYQQCRYSYYPELRVRELANQFRLRKIPADVIYLDIDYQDGFRPFTINRKFFPQFEQMVADLKLQGFKTVVISDPHLKKEAGYPPYDQGMAGDFFVKNPNGTPYAGNVWPGESVFPDLTLSSARKWYGSLYQFFTSKGVAGFWNDMNEPAVFHFPEKSMPIDTLHRVDSETENRVPPGPVRTTDHREIHNVYGMQQARATFEALLELRPNERPFVLTRAAYAGTQRYAATWTGDNQSTWEQLRLTVSTLLNLGVSGYAFSGADVGGFDGSPSPELLTRWMELGAFLPIFRNHTSANTLDQEPWVHGPEHEAIRRRYIEARYRLMPYIYTTMEEASRTGVPSMRAFFLEQPFTGRIGGINDHEFFFGSDLLVAPKLNEMLSPYDVILPEGIWYDYWSGARVEGKSQPAWKLLMEPVPNPPAVSVLEVAPALDVLPVYVRGGAIIPLQPLVQNTAEKPIGPLELRVYPGPNCSGSVYTDDGISFNYKKGEYFRQTFTCEVTNTGVIVSLSAAQGNFVPWWTQLRVTVLGRGQSISRDLPFSRSPQSVTVSY